MVFRGEEYMALAPGIVYAYDNTVAQTTFFFMLAEESGYYRIVGKRYWDTGEVLSPTLHNLHPLRHIEHEWYNAKEEDVAAIAAINKQE